jgi:predicted amidophosphoribosyltransferase
MRTRPAGEERIVTTTRNHACCPDCRLRLASAEAAYLTACPECGEPLQSLAGLSGAVGFRLFRPEDSPQSLPEAISVSMEIPE